MTVIPPSALSARLPSLTGMRFLAALLVFMCHVATSQLVDAPGLNRSLAENAAQLGWVGVSFFFILSGFVLTWTARAGDTPRLFIRRRLTKVYPNHLVTWVAGTAFLATAGTVTVFGVLPSLGLIQAWFPIPAVTFGPNDPSWSLCAELVFYLLCPWLLPLVNRIPAGWLWKVAGVLVLVLALIPVVAQLLPEQPLMTYYQGPSCKVSACEGTSWWHYWFVYIVPVSRLPEFLLGMVISRVVALGKQPSLRPGTAALLLIPGYAVMVALPDAYGMVWPTAIPLALVVMASASADLTGRSWMGGRTMVRLGELSFAFYMVHLLVLRHGPLAAGSGKLWSPAAAVALVGLSAALTLAAAWLLHVLVEQPVMRRWSRPRRIAPPPQASAAQPGQRVP
ncbi:acyltransferase family protein [Streptomyces inhibens]|uniref:acyltransferase family protein n=1 Tax=Streptomyces inhibens TaxID=2293571 RepID=UPI00402AFC28